MSFDFLRSRTRTRTSVLLAGAIVLLGLTTAASAQRGQAPVAAAPRLTKPPALEQFVEAPYPDAERANPRAATVILSVAIAETGDVLQVEVVESAGEHFDAAAVAAVKQFRFTPAEIDNVPAPVKITYRYAFAEPPPVVTTGTFRGVVSDKLSGAPLAGVTVRVEVAPATGGAGAGAEAEAEAGAEAAPAPFVAEVVTGADGSFVFADIPAGTVHVTLSRSDLTPIATEEVLAAGTAIDVRYDLELPAAEEADEEADDLEILVTAPPELVKSVVSTEVAADEASRLPGTQGDVLKVVENLPGIARASAGTGDVVVWGAAPQDTRTYVDAVRIPMLYHFGGLRSVMHNDTVAKVELIPGGYGAAYGRGLGGLVKVGRKGPSTDGLHGSVQADLLDASAALTGPINDRVSFLATGRGSYIAQLGGLLGDQSFQQFFTLPQYYDGQTRVRYQASPGKSVEVGGFISGDQRTRTQPSNDPALQSFDEKTLNFQRVDVAYRSESSSGSVFLFAPWYGHDMSDWTTDYGGVPANSHTTTHLVGLRSEWRGHLAEPLSGTMGLDFELAHSTSERNGAITFPNREGDPYLFGRTPADQLAYDKWDSTTLSAAPYVELDWAPLEDKLHVVPGIRVEPYLIQAERKRPQVEGTPDQKAFGNDIAVEPRLAVRYSPIDRLTLHAATGLYDQPPLADDLSAVFGNPTLGTASGVHVLGGVGVRLFDTVHAEATAFHTRSKDLTSRNPAENPQIAEALVQEGEGRTVGGQFMLRKDKGESRVFGWVAYTVMRSERRAGSGAWRLFDYDQTHVFTAVGSWEIGAGFEAGLRFRIATGFPRTPVTGAFYDSRTNRYEPVLGELNTIRIPIFFQLDARVSKHFDIGDTELEVYLDVLNATNRENPEELAYSPDYTDKRYVLGLPILPVLGARWEF